MKESPAPFNARRVEQETLVLSFRQQGHATGHDAFADGVKACAGGVPRAACPYSAASSEAEDWLAGWDDEAARTTELAES